MSNDTVQKIGAHPEDSAADRMTTVDQRAALVLVDLQEFVRTLPYSTPIGEVLQNAGKLAAAWRQTDLPVVLTVVAGLDTGRRDVVLQASGTLSAEQMAVAPEVDRQPSDVVVPKRHWGAFTGTRLEEELRERGVTQVVVAGVATGFGVDSTARSASELGFNVLVVRDAVSDMNAAVHSATLDGVFPQMSEVRSTAEILGALESRG